MPRAVVFPLALLLAVPAVAAPADAARRVVVVLPPAAAAEDDGLSLVMQARASALLVGGGGFQDIHAKQILRVAEREALSRDALGTAAGAAVMARRFGADRVVFGTLARQAGGGWTLSLATAPGGKAPARVKLPADAARAVEEGAAALARAAGGTVAAGKPASTSATAVVAYGRCYATIVEQPLLVDTPMVLDTDKVADAVAACRNAVGADPDYRDASAALGLALALAGKDDDAVNVLAQVKEDDGYLPLYWLARYWLVTRFQSGETGTVALKKAIERHPYFTLARGYLGQHLSVLRHDAEALEAWRVYQKELPRSAFVRGGASHSLARLGRNDEAIAEAKAAVADHPDDDEAKLELASRYVDARKDADAIAVLEPLASKPTARAETKLRLGFAYARQGNATAAEKWLGDAEAAARRPAEWRTRARARIDRGVLLIKSGRTQEGQALLASAQRGGLAEYIEGRKDAELSRMVKDAEVAQRDKKVLDFSIKIPTETSPFPLDGTGELDPPRRPPPAPKMFEVLRF